MIIKKGIAASEGYALGTAYVLEKESFEISKYMKDSANMNREVRRLDSAISKAKCDLEKTRKYLSKKKFNKTIIQIVGSHYELTQDKLLISEFKNRIKQNKYTPEYAISDVIRKKVKTLEMLPQSELTTRIKESLTYIKNLLLGYLIERNELVVPDEGKWIIVAEDLTPTETLSIEKNSVVGICLDKGGRTSHTAIVASSLGIPCVVAMKDLTGEVTTGDSLVIDAFDGGVFINPDRPTLDYYSKKSEQYYVYGQKYSKSERTTPAKTRDGTRIELLANIEFPEEVKLALEFGAEGVGLYRTEFLYTGHKIPDERHQFNVYKKAIQLLGKRECTIRTADLGADKLALVRSPAEANPLMGLRGIRFSYEHMDMFKTQLKAIVRASMLGSVRLILPLITSVLEVIKFKTILKETFSEIFRDTRYSKAKIRLGVMLETPASCMMADVLSKYVDFFAVGTNDLIAYMLAVDRSNELVSQLYQPYHPSLLRMLNQIATTVNAQKVDTSVCGEIASDPVYSLVLIGFGFKKLSMVPHRIPEIKRILSTVRIDECRSITKKLLKITNVREAEDFIRNTVDKLKSTG